MEIWQGQKVKKYETLWMIYSKTEFLLYQILTLMIAEYVFGSSMNLVAIAVLLKTIRNNLDLKTLSIKTPR